MSNYNTKSDAVMLVIGRLKTDPLFCSALLTDRDSALRDLVLKKHESDEVNAFLDDLDLAEAECGNLTLTELDIRLQLASTKSGVAIQPNFITWGSQT